MRDRPHLREPSPPVARAVTPPLQRAEAAPVWLPALLLAGSGAVALVYETLWMRGASTLFGATAPAAAATVSAMFAGLALGSAWFGRRAPRWGRPLRVYAVLELGAAAAALLVLPLQRAFAALAPALHAALADVPALLLAARTVQVFAAVLPATFLLGGTLPVVTHAVDDRRGAGGLACGRLYAANTLGAIAGALAVPFVLLPAVGAARAYLLAALAGAALGAAAWGLGRGSAWAGTTEIASTTEEAPPLPLPPSLLALAFASGFTLLGLELVWVRMLSQVHLNSVHAFAVVLAVFLAALFLGAALGTALARRGAPVLERLWTSAGLLTLAAPAVFVPLTGGLDFLASASRAGYQGRLLLACAASFAPATVAGGTVLPLLLARAAGAAGPAAPAVGRLLAANTAGCILGPLATTFALFPWLGMWGSTVALGLAQVVLGVARAPGRGPALAALAAAALLSWHALDLPRVRVDTARGEALVWLREGSHGIASVVRERESLRLKLDNTYTLGGTSSSGDARMLGHLPLLLHGSPRRVAFLGLGTGITAGAALAHPVEELALFELVPEVALAARTVFAEENRRLLADPRVHLVVDDARSHLAAAPERYDVVVGDLVVPWRRGESALFTREHFAGVRRALAPDGLFCQWLPLYQMSEEELRIVAATFLDVFPHAALFRGDFVAALPTLGLVGLAGERALDPVAIDARVRAGAGSLAQDSGYLVHPAGFWLYHAGELSAAAPWVADTRRNTVDLPWLELLAARSSGGERTADALRGEPLLAFLAELRRSEEALLPLDGQHRRWRDLGGELFHASCLDDAREEEEARAHAFAVLEELPGEIRARLFGPAAER